jgi:hypothetical protein
MHSSLTSVQRSSSSLPVPTLPYQPQSSEDPFPSLYQSSPLSPSPPPSLSPSVPSLASQNPVRNVRRCTGGIWCAGWEFWEGFSRVLCWSHRQLQRGACVGDGVCLDRSLGGCLLDLDVCLSVDNGRCCSVHVGIQWCCHRGLSWLTGRH